MRSVDQEGDSSLLALEIDGAMFQGKWVPIGAESSSYLTASKEVETLVL